MYEYMLGECVRVSLMLDGAGYFDSAPIARRFPGIGSSGLPECTRVLWIFQAIGFILIKG